MKDDPDHSLMTQAEETARRNAWIDAGKVALVKAALVEIIAAIEHDQWVFWSQAVAHEILNLDRKKRWEKSWVPYGELSEEMKEHDRVWARKVIDAILDSIIPDCPYHKYQCPWDGKPEEHYCKKDESVIQRIDQHRHDEREKIFAKILSEIDTMIDAAEEKAATECSFSASSSLETIRYARTKIEELHNSQEMQK